MKIVSKKKDLSKNNSDYLNARFRKQVNQLFKQQHVNAKNCYQNR